MSENAALLPKAFAALQFSHLASAVGLKVFEVVARLAKRESVTHVESQGGVRRERFDVVRSEVAPLGVTALLAGVEISAEHSVSPLEIFGSSSVIQSPLSAAVTERVMLLSTGTADANHSTNLCSRLGSVPHAFTARRNSYSRLSHLLKRLRGMLLSFERRDASFSAHAHFYPSTVETRTVDSVASSSVLSEAFQRLPFLTARASFVTGANALTEFVNWYASAGSSRLDRAIFRLRHTVPF